MDKSHDCQLGRSPSHRFYTHFLPLLNRARGNDLLPCTSTSAYLALHQPDRFQACGKNRMRFRSLFLTTLFSLLGPATVSAQIGLLEPDLQIRLAVQAIPEDLRAAATVQGYDPSGSFVTLREGTNEMICMAPNPDHDDLEVSCHHIGLEPFFARGRQLRAEGVTGRARIQARLEEVASGALPLPSGTTNHILTGSGFDPETGEIQAPYLRWVIYVPGATGASSGLTEHPASPGVPWLMSPGTHGAHIMISPPRGH